MGKGDSRNTIVIVYFSGFLVLFHQVEPVHVLIVEVKKRGRRKGEKRRKVEKRADEEFSVRPDASAPG